MYVNSGLLFLLEVKERKCGKQKRKLASAKQDYGDINEYRDGYFRIWCCEEEAE